MRRFYRFVVMLGILASAVSVASARAKYQGWCVTAAGTRSLGCTVRVLLSGTSTQATLYSNNAGQSLANPFTADPLTGLFSFYADNGKYDISFSGGNPSITVPYTLSAILLLDNTTTNQTTSFAGNVFPTVSLNDDLGSALFQWRTVYANALTISGGSSFGAPLLPLTDGVALGSAANRWNLFAKNITFYSNGTASASLQHSNTTPRTYTFPDFTGTVPLLNLAQTWTALQTFNGGISFANATFDTLTSSSTNPSTAGDIRLASNDSLQFRNLTNTANINALSIDSTSGLLNIGNPLANIQLNGPGGIQVSPIVLYGPLNSPFDIFARTTSTNSPGAQVVIEAASATTGNNNGGSVYLIPGIHSGSGQDGSVTIFGGISNGTGSGFQHKRQTTGSITNGTRAEVTISWAGGFADTNYTVVCTVNDPTSGATATGLVLERTRQQTSGLVSVVVNNPTAGALTGTVDCIAVHDGL